MTRTACRILIVGLPVLALAALVYGAASAQRTYRLDGPIQPVGGAAGVEAPLAPGKTGTWAMPLPFNETAADIQIESVDALNPRGLTILGINASYPGPSDGIVFVPGYPPDGVTSEPIENARMSVFGSERAILQLLIGVQRTGTAPGTIDGLRVRYVSGETRYETVFPWTLKATDAAP
jgi:hypothetical protein